MDIKTAAQKERFLSLFVCPGDSVKFQEWFAETHPEIDQSDWSKLCDFAILWHDKGFPVVPFSNGAWTEIYYSEGYDHG